MRRPAPAPMPIFLSEQRRALRLACLGTGGIHTLLALLLFSLALWRFGGAPSVQQSEIEPTPLELVEIDGEGDGPMDAATARARIRLGIQDRREQSPEELMRSLEELLPLASGISNQSLDGIAAFLGKREGAYQVRTAYLDELNRNLNMVTARIVAAVLETPTRAALTLEDPEQDRFVFTLTGTGLSALAAAGPTVEGQPLIPGGAGGFELIGARIEKIAEPVGIRTDLTLRDPQGRRLSLPIEGPTAHPFIAERRRFDLLAKGHVDDGSTLHLEGFDTESAALLPPGDQDFWQEDGVLVARKTLLDAAGERWIQVFHGEMAKEFLDQTKVLRNDVLRNIYERGLLHLLPGMRREREAEMRRQQKIRERRAAEAEAQKGRP